MLFFIKVKLTKMIYCLLFLILAKEKAPDVKPTKIRNTWSAQDVNVFFDALYEVITITSSCSFKSKYALNATLKSVSLLPFYGGVLITYRKINIINPCVRTRH